MNKISIITATYNAESCLQELINSLFTQGNADFEFIIVDGGSTDSTIDIIRNNNSAIDNWISEPDKGIYDAWNKGVALATGNWIMFLGADDMLMPGALEKYYSFLASQPDDLLFLSSRRQMLDVKGNLIRTTGYTWSWPLFQKFMTVSHPGALHSDKLFDQYGMYDVSYKISGDYELLLRPRNQLKAAFMDEVTVKMSEGGASDSIAAVGEYYRATTTAGGYSKIKAGTSATITILKFIIKKGLRKIGLNVYLQK